MGLLGDANDLRQREERLSVFFKFRFDRLRADVDEMALPVPTDRAMLALHGVKQALALDMDLPARDRLERATRLYLSRHIDKTLAGPLLQALADELCLRFLAGGEHEQGGVCRLPQMPGGGRARAFDAARELINDLLRRAPIGESDLVEREPYIGAGDGKGIEASLGAGPCYAEGAVGCLKRPAVDGLPGIRDHRLADRRGPMEVIASPWLARKTQKRRRKERRERERHVGVALKRRGNFGRPFRRRAFDVEPMTSRGLVEHICRVERLWDARRRDDLIRPRKNPVRADLSPTHSGHADDFASWLKAQEAYERLLGHLATDRLNAGFHHQTNGRCAGSGQVFPGKLEEALLAVSLPNAVVMPPILPVAFPRQIKFMRPRHR